MYNIVAGIKASGRCSSAYCLRLAIESTDGCPVALDGFWPLFAAGAAVLAELCLVATKICCLQALVLDEMGLASDEVGCRDCSGMAGRSFLCVTGMIELAAGDKEQADKVEYLWENYVQEAANPCSFRHTVDRLT